MLKAGWSRADITPPVGLDLCGFGGRPGPSAGVHDPLVAKALCVSDGARGIALITADLIGLDAATVAELRRRVCATLGEGAPALMVACSHTHSGPSTPCLPFLGRPDPTYLAGLNEALVGLVVEAWQARREAQIGYGQAPAQVGINRRERLADGRITLGRNDAGLTAPYVDVLRVETAAGCAVLFSHAAHPVTLGGDNVMISGDWPGYAQRIAEAQLGERCLTLYGQGCCGDINSDAFGGFEVIEAQGRVVADAVTSLVPSIPLAGDSGVASASVVIDLPLQDPPPVEAARASLASHEQSREAHFATDGYGLRIMREGMVDWARRVLALAEAGATDLTQPYEIQALRLGEGVIVGLPGEVFVSYQQQIKACSPFAHTFVLAYANGNPGYVPTAAAFPEGGYEVDSAICCYGTTMLKPDCERLIVEAACRLLRGL